MTLQKHENQDVCLQSNSSNFDDLSKTIKVKLKAVLKNPATSHHLSFEVHDERFMKVKSVFLLKNNNKIKPNP